MKKLVLVWGLMISAVSIYAVQTVWIANGSPADFSHPNNWNNGVPTFEDQAVFDGSGTADCQITSKVYVHDVLVLDGYAGQIVQMADLYVGGNFELNTGVYSLDAEYDLFVWGTVDISSTFTMLGNLHNPITFIAFDDWVSLKSSSDWNWIAHQVLSSTGASLASEKTYFDPSARLVQHQNLVQSRGDRIVKGELYDSHVGPSLNTPIGVIEGSDLEFESTFLHNSESAGSHVLDTYLPGDEVSFENYPGTMANYWSDGNQLESMTASTNRPFTETDPSYSLTGGMSRQGGVGETGALDNGHFSGTIRMPIMDELNHYLQIRNTHMVNYSGLYPAGAFKTANNLAHRGVKEIKIDRDGVESVFFYSNEGGLLASCRSGEGNTGNAVITQINSGVINGTTVTFHLPKGLASYDITVLTTDNTVPVRLVNLYTGNEVYVGALGSVPSTLSAGVFRIESEVSFSATVQCPVNYYDLAYNFYDDDQRLFAQVPPKGVNTGASTAPQYLTTYKFDSRGRMIQKTTPDAGTTHQAYDTQGHLSFVQDAGQAQRGELSYFEYDNLGRILESGIYVPTISSPVVYVLLADFFAAKSSPGIKKQVITYGYDELDAVFGSEQENVYGRLSSQTTPVSKLIYSYDWQGRVVKLIKEMAVLGTKRLEFEYNDLDQNSKIIYQAGQADQFIHEYTYDGDGRITKVRTSQNGTQWDTEAAYSYYAHGPLKRVVYGDNVQGVDYVYALNGQLKSINNANLALDPSQDGTNGVAADVFGLTLDYHSQDYQRLGSPIASLNYSNQEHFNGLLRGMRWDTRVPTGLVASDDPNNNDFNAQATSYALAYDINGQLKTAVSGVENGTYFLAGSGQFDLSMVNYDPNGNILDLERKGHSGVVKNNFIYNYIPGSNKLLNVYDQKTGSTYVTFDYDANGRVVAIHKSVDSKYLTYAANGKMSGVYHDLSHTQPLMLISYDELDQRLSKTLYDGAANPVTTTWYVNFSGRLVSMYQFDHATSVTDWVECPIHGVERLGILYRPSGSSLKTYELTDHVGNVRAVVEGDLVNGEAQLVSYSDYFPYGSLAKSWSNEEHRYGYQGQFAETDEETELVNFDLRNYDPEIGRWLSIDPAGQHLSPYMAMGNNPLQRVDPDGGCDDPADPNCAGATEFREGDNDLIMSNAPEEGDFDTYYAYQEAFDAWETAVIGATHRLILFNNPEQLTTWSVVRVERYLTDEEMHIAILRRQKAGQSQPSATSSGWHYSGPSQEEKIEHLLNNSFIEISDNGVAYVNENRLIAKYHIGEPGEMQAQRTYFIQALFQQNRLLEENGDLFNDTQSVNFDASFQRFK